MNRLLTFVLCLLGLPALAAFKSDYAKTNALNPEYETVYFLSNTVGSERRLSVADLYNTFKGWDSNTTTYALSSLPPRKAGTPRRVILDTDIGNDVDDVGDVTMACNLHALGLIDLAGIAYCGPARSTNYGAALAEIICNHYGVAPAFGTSTNAASSFYAGEQLYGPLLYTNFFSVLQHNTNAMEGASFYRKLLSQYPGKTTIILVGMMDNLEALYNSTADQWSSLNGSNLMAQKVQEIIIVAGEYPGPGYEYNFYAHATTSLIINKLGFVPITYTSFDLGNSVKSLGTPWLEKLDPSGPTYMAYTNRVGFAGREAWGQLGLLYAGIGTNWMGTNIFKAWQGTNQIVSGSGGSNVWWPNVGSHCWLSNTVPAGTISNIIGRIITYLPGAMASRSSGQASFADGIEVGPGSVTAKVGLTNAGQLVVNGPPADDTLKMETMMSFTRGLTDSKSYGQGVMFQMGRYATDSLLPRTRFGISLKWDTGFTYAGFNGTPMWSVRSDGAMESSGPLLIGQSTWSATGYNWGDILASGSLTVSNGMTLKGGLNVNGTNGITGIVTVTVPGGGQTNLVFNNGIFVGKQ